MQISFDFQLDNKPIVSRRYNDVDAGDGLCRWVTWRERGVTYRGILTWLGDDLAQGIIMQQSDFNTERLGWHSYFYTSQIKNIKQIKKRITTWVDRLND